MSLAILKKILGEANFDAPAHWNYLGENALRFVLESHDPFAEGSIEQLRGNLAEILASGHFELHELAPETLPEFAILTFPGFERVLPQEQLFEIGYELADAFGLASCEPDIGMGFVVDPSQVPPPTAEGARTVSALCLVDPPPPGNRLWAIENAKIDRAWSHTKGESILVAQPDTGVAMHAALPAASLRLDPDANILEPGTDPIDPLDGGMANPGHGTATGSAVIASGIDAISGAAPGATLLPIRCINDVKIVDAAPVARAIAYARSAGADVISMSLGGRPSRAVRKAVGRAIDDGMIVVSAAGNCVRTVVWPARYEGPIAAGGTNIDDKPWKGSSRGSAVDICAPAEHVWIARRAAPDDTDLDRVEASQGTSFATALIAGTAALWLSHHGREAVRAAAAAKGVSVQALFKSALRETARVPADWDHNNFGAGILDAEALLDLPLDGIAGISPHGAPPSLESAIGPLDSELDRIAEVDERFATELATISLNQHAMGETLGEVHPESKRPGVFASQTLMDHIARGQRRNLDGLLTLEDGTTSLVMPHSRLPEQEISPGVLLKTAGSRLEATGESLSLEAASSYLGDGGREEQIRALESVLGDAPNSSSIDRAALESTMEFATAALDTLAGNRLMDAKAVIGLEALVLINGRPAFLLGENNRIDFSDPELGEWGDRLIMSYNTSELQTKLGAIGRIDADGIHWGTGFVVGDGLVLTNRHVLQAIAAPIPRKNRPSRWMLTGSTTSIDFASEPTSQTGTSKFTITGVVEAGALDIRSDDLDFSKLDAALLQVETSNGAGQTLPEPINLVKTTTATDPKAMDVYGIGYPARPAHLPRLADGMIDLEVLERIVEIFGKKYGRKYLAPGLITERKNTVFYHDLTTLGGFSGSPVLRTNESYDAIGLHFGGAFRRENYAHDLPALFGSGSFLTRPGVNWTD